MSQARMTVTQLCVVAAAAALLGCTDQSSEDVAVAAQLETCMSCHNGGLHNDYSGPGLENPHPFTGGGTIKCTTCHGGDPAGAGQLGSHVPPPPEIGDRTHQETSQLAYFNRLTLTGIDKFSSYVVGGVTYSPLDYLQFINPGDLRVVTQGRGCGKCHAGHAESVAQSLLATEAGMLSGAMYAVGAANDVPDNAGRFEDTAADLAFRALVDPDYVFDPAKIGAIGELVEYPVFSVRGETGPLDLFQNPLYDADLLESDLEPDGSNRVITGSNLANLYHEQVAFTCGDCHLGSAGANNRYGDFRSSGCTACHMRYSLDGRSRSTDPRINKLEPVDPDNIEAPERPHVRRHLITSVATTLHSGEAVQGIDDYTCAGCHQGSNRTVMQFWGIRLDQNADLARGVQYPAPPASFRNTADDTRLFDPVVGNKTFNGRNPNQYIRFEDYDGDDRDDTPPDVHYEAGMGCIDCHGSHELHGSPVANPSIGNILSRQDQAVAIRCESCHGAIDAYAATQPGLTYDGQPADLAVDARGNVLRNVVKEASGTYYLTSRLTGKRHYIKQTRDTVVDSGKLHPTTGLPIYNAKASYAMGRSDGDPATGIGPQQTGGTLNGFSHADNMSCVSCHASWTGSCIGCHLEGEYDEGNNFSNITGERIVFRERNADFVYQTPVPFQLGVDAHNRISPLTGNTAVFFKYKDLNDKWSKVFAFSDRNGGGNQPGTFGALGHNVMMPHSIRGRVTDENEGPRYCAACHLTVEGLADFAATYGATKYDDFRTAMRTDDFAALDFDLLQEHIGENPGNRLNSPLWVHMVSGLGSGLFLFDEFGCPVNTLDDDDRRKGCNFLDFDQDAGQAPSAIFDPLRTVYSLDRLVDDTGRSFGSNNHPLLEPGAGPSLRDGAQNENLSGPLGATLIEKLTDPVTGIVLDAWIDANGDLQGDAGTFVP